MRAVNLIPPEQRRGAGGIAGRTGGAVYVIIGALLALVVLGVVYAYAVRDVAKRTTTLAEVTNDVLALQQRAATLNPYTVFQAFAGERIVAVSELAEERFDWARAMAQIALALPPTVTLLSLSGATASSSTPTTAPPAGFSLSGCADNQPVVATTLSRLRELKDVASVTVQSWTKPEGVPLGLRNVVALADAGACPYVMFNMTLSYNAGYGIPAPHLPPGVSVPAGSGRG
ncbi:MAG: hypothetical protein ABSG64_10350 [Solirubrobacteraceae bacterium]